MDSLDNLKAIAGERHARDQANNPELSGSAVPAGSAAQKTDSALGHFTAGLATNQNVEPCEPQRVVKAASGESIPLDAEPALAEKIAGQAQTANNPAAADHFSEAASNLQSAYKQDKAWLAKHPNMDQGSRT